MKYQNGLRVYAVVKFEKYPEWNVLIVDLKSESLGDSIYEYEIIESVTGLAFNNKGEFEIRVNLALPMEYKEVGYIYPYKESDTKLNLHLDKRS